MPLHKRTPFALVEPPNDLNPNEHVFQVRFTKEIFRDYQDYLNRLNLYRQRIWTCKATWKSNLTYEEALVSEHRATEKVQLIPIEYLAPILQMVQYSTLTLKYLADTIIAKLQGHMFVGMELHGRKDQSVCPCKILKLEDSRKTIMVGWLNKKKTIVDTSTVDADCLILKKPPISRSLLKSFIRESTFQSAPWLVHEKLAQKYGLRMDPPEQLRDMIGRNCYIVKGAECHMIHRKRKQADQDEPPVQKMKKRGNEEKINEKPVKYPIDDLLVKPGADDPVFADRPPLSRDFMIPVDCVGVLLMVWDFCSSFGRVLNLWPFSLEDFEKAICYKDGALIIIIETHSALLNVLIKDGGEYSAAVQNRKHKLKITLTNWNEYLCDFLEFKGEPELSSHISIIKRGHYGLLDINTKLKLLQEMVNAVLVTDAIRNKLDGYIKRKQILAASRKEGAQSMREGNDTNKEESISLEINKGNMLMSTDVNIEHHKSDGDCVEDKGGQANRNKNVLQIDGSHKTLNGKLEVYSRKFPKKSNQNDTIITEEVGNSSGIVECQKKKQIKKEKDAQGQEKKSDEQRKQNLAREREKQFLRMNTLGKDRDYNRYWFFRRDGRLFVESLDSKQWGFYAAKEELDAFMDSLNPKGVRERALQMQLRKHYDRISTALQKRSKDVAQRVLLEEAVLRRSTRVRAQPRDSPAMAFLRYTNKWRED